jgi:hypothetical protein
VAPVFWHGGGDKPNPALEKVLKKGGLKTPPHLYEAAKKYITAAWQKEAFEAGLGLQRLSYSLVVPTGVPEKVYAAWREVFSKIVGDQRFVKSLNPQDRARLAPMYGNEIQQTLDTVKNLSPEALRLLKKLVEGR